MSKQTLARKILPYAIETKEGADLVMNRDYQPLCLPEHGQNPGHGARTIRVDGMTSARAMALSCRERRATEAITLFHDGCPPWLSKKDFERYMWRLWQTCKLKAV